jgi:hypothetical protein
MVIYSSPDDGEIRYELMQSCTKGIFVNKYTAAVGFDTSLPEAAPETPQLL